MKKSLIATIPLVLALAGVLAFGQQTPPEQAPPPKAPPRLTFADRMKQYLKKIGSTIDDSKSAPDMVVSSHPDPKGKITIVLVNDRRRNLIGFYIYNFGSLKDAANKEEVYKYLLAANDAITIGSFFVDGEEDIGYKYLVSGGQAMSQAAFESAYFTMAAVARERKS